MSQERTTAAIQVQELLHALGGNRIKYLRIATVDFQDDSTLIAPSTLKPALPILAPFAVELLVDVLS